MKPLLILIAACFVADMLRGLRERVRRVNRADAYAEIRGRPRRAPLSETPAMRRASEWVPD